MDISTLKNECYFLFIFILYILFSEYGRIVNASRAKKWFEILYPFFTSQFIQVGLKKNDPMPLRFQNPAYFISYATGRIYIDYLYMQFKFPMRQNIISFLKHILIAFFMDKPVPKDRLYIDMVISDNVFDDFVFAVVNKAHMRWLCEKYYHLSFTRVLETPLLPETYVVMSEFSEIMSILLEDNKSFTQCIQTSNSELEYLIISDQPAKRPKNPDQTFRKTITFCVQLPSLRHPDNVLSIVTQCIAFVDTLVNRAHWRSNIIQKIKAARDEANRKLKKLDEEKLAKILKKKAEKDKQEKERIRKLSSQEQKKYLEKERERKYKKQIKIIKT